MGYDPATPFRRMAAAALPLRCAADKRPPSAAVDKWEALRELADGQARLGVTSRELGVLQALLSFHPGRHLGGGDADLVVHPSNASICRRLNGMPCSTMRRHLAALVRAGLVRRRDSPNGKRFARRNDDGKEAFGFDLTPLVTRFAEICAAADAMRREERRRRALRSDISLMRRDLVALAGEESSGMAADVARALRRNLSLEDLSSLRGTLERALAAAVSQHEPRETSTDDGQNEHHPQRSDADHSESGPDGNAQTTDQPPDLSAPQATLQPSVAAVLTLCPELATYHQEPIRHWGDLTRTAEAIGRMMGVSPAVWRDATAAMGAEGASITIAAMLQRYGEIRSPGGYLRHLVHRAEAGRFDPGRMLSALATREDASPFTAVNHDLPRAGSLGSQL